MMAAAAAVTAAAAAVTAATVTAAAAASLYSSRAQKSIHSQDRDEIEKLNLAKKEKKNLTGSFNFIQGKDRLGLNRGEKKYHLDFFIQRKERGKIWVDGGLGDYR